MSIPKENIIIAKAALNAFGGKPKVIKYWDENKISSIDIQIVIDKPYNCITSYSTIGLYNYTIGFKVDEESLNIELVGACKSKYNLFPNILSTCAFNIINSKYTCYPGAIFKNVIEMYLPDIEMKHILFTSPFLWNDNLKTINLENKKVAWLMVIPISDAEYKYAMENRYELLEDVFEEEDIDFLDLNRESVFDLR